MKKTANILKCSSKRKLYEHLVDKELEVIHDKGKEVIVMDPVDGLPIAIQIEDCIINKYFK